MDSSLHKKGNQEFYSQQFDVTFYWRYSSREKRKYKDQYKYRNRFFYEFPSDYQKSEYNKTIVIFFLEGGRSFFIPLSILVESINRDKLQVASDNKYKLHINAVDPNAVVFEEIRSLKLQDYSNQFGLQNIKNIIISVKIDNNKIEKLDLLSSPNYMEGNIREVLCNQYERDPRARQKCIEFYGLNCYICGFNFQKFYGNYGSNFIHVHHLVPISKIGKDYIVNPDKDLIPLCANCHAIVHRVDPPYTPQEVKESINCPLADSQK